MECLEYVILHELIHLRERTHNEEFIAYMDLYMQNWREIRKQLNDSMLDYYDAQDENPLQKLIDQRRYGEIRDAVLSHLGGEVKQEKATLSYMKIQDVVHIEQPEEGYICFDIIVSCDMAYSSLKSDKISFQERWLRVHCQVLLGIELTGFQIVYVTECGQMEEADSEKFSGELVPAISRNSFEDEAARFLEKYYPEALKEAVPVPIRRIAENMGLTVIEKELFSDGLDAFGILYLEDGNIQDKNKNIAIRNAKRGMMFIDPQHYYGKTFENANEKIAHECFHWYRHLPYHLLMKMLGVKDDVGGVICCTVHFDDSDTEKWNSLDWMEWQANGIVPYILMPAKTATRKIEEMLREYHINFDDAESECQIEKLISELAEFYGLSEQATRIRINELGFYCVNDVLGYVPAE